MLFYYMTYMNTPQHKNPCQGGHEIYNFGRPFLGHHYQPIYLVCLIFVWEQRRRFFKKYINYSRFTPKLPPLGSGCDEICNLLSPYPTDATYHIFKIGPVVLEKKMITHDGRRRTPIHSNMSPANSAKHMNDDFIQKHQKGGSSHNTSYCHILLQKAKLQGQGHPFSRQPCESVQFTLIRLKIDHQSTN